MDDLARWGTRIELEAGRGRIVDRDGVEVARVDGERAWVRGAPGCELALAPGVDHPIFGRSLELTSGGRLCSVMAAVDWAAPRLIPPVAEPGALPAHAGTALLNLLAACAAAAGISEVGYRGPYPTSALYGSLTQCFRAHGDEASFTAESGALLAAPRMAQAPVTFSPAPFARWWPSPRIGVQARAAIERVLVDGAAFTSSTSTVRRLVRADDEPERLRAEVWFGDARWAIAAELTADGGLVRGPLPAPPIDDAIVGQEVPLALRRALADLICDAAPAPLAPLIPAVLERARLRWGDAGHSPVVTSGDTVTLHAALWLHLRPHGLARLALAMAEALTPWAVGAAVRAAQ